MAVSAARAQATQLDAAITMIEVRDLVKRYPKRPVNAVDGVSFMVPRGEVFGLLGPNGAGKTTTVGILTTRVRPTGGLAAIAGMDVARHPVVVRRSIAVVPQRNNLDRSLSARQNLVFHAAYFGMSRHEREERADFLLAQFGLEGRGGDKVDNSSGGMAQRLMIARALMHEPEVLFLDEPTTGLDPQARLFVWDRIRELNARGLTILLTTHDMDEADQLCRRVAIMDHGRILAMDTPAALKSTLPGSSAIELHLGPLEDERLEALLEALGDLPAVERAERVEQRADASPGAFAAGPWPGAPIPAAEPAGAVIRVYCPRDPALIGRASAVVAEHHAQLTDIHISGATLEDVFIQLTGRALR
jgi:ABC-2 type transport system ATP-binding protein